VDEPGAPPRATPAEVPRTEPGSAPRATPAGGSEAERGRAILSLAILAFRWVTLAWMAVLALTAGPLRRPALAAAAILLLAGWTAWLTLARPAPSWPLLAADLALAVA